MINEQELDKAILRAKRTLGFLESLKCAKVDNVDEKEKIKLKEELQEALEIWNSYTNVEAVGNIGTYRNKSLMRSKKLMMRCNSLSPAILQVGRAISSKYKKEGILEVFKRGLNQYIIDILNREPNGTYCDHRFSFIQFLRQGNAMADFEGRDEKIKK